MKRKIFLRLLSLAMAILLSLLALTACKTPDDNGGAEVEGFYFSLLSSEGNACRVLYPDGADEKLIAEANKIASAVTALTGKTVSAAADSSAEKNGALILVGKTSHEASTSFYKTLRRRDGGYKIVANDVLCIGAHDTVLFSDMVSKFEELLSKKEALATAITVGGKTYKNGYYLLSANDSLSLGSYPLADLTVNGAPLGEFRIIHASEKVYADAASTLQGTIASSTGYVLDTVSADSAQAAEHEIIIGNVPADLTNDFYAQSEEQTFMDYRIAISGTKIAILAANEITLDSAIVGFEDTFLSSSTEARALNNDSSFDGNFLGHKTVNIEKRIKESDIRIVSNNIYLYSTDRASSFATRTPIMLRNLRACDADVILLQECGGARSTTNNHTAGKSWHDWLDPELVKYGYTYVPAKTGKTALAAKDNYTPIWYRADVLDLVKYGFEHYDTVKYYPAGDISYSKSYTWALFSIKETGERFVAISTHFTWADDVEQSKQGEPSYEELKISDANELVAFIEKLQNRYGKDIPVVAIGDLNTTVTDQPYQILDSIMDDPKFMTDIKEHNLEYNTYHHLGEAIGKNSRTSTVDHAFVCGSGFKAVQYQRAINDWAVNATDHVPLVLDLDFSS